MKVLYTKYDEQRKTAVHSLSPNTDFTYTAFEHILIVRQTIFLCKVEYFADCMLIYV